MRRRPLHLFALLLLLLTSPLSHAQKPWPIRAVVVATFEVGHDTGDAPGEFQFWVEREHLDEVVPFPGGVRPLRTNKEHTVLGMVSGTTLVNATASMMALGLDPRFDLTHAYVLINGIAGVDPKAASIGSVAWAKFAINDVARYIDPREMPKDWPYGYFPTNAKAPNPPTVDVPQWHRSNVYPLNAKLVDWAFEQTRSIDLGDDARVKAFRETYTGFPEAQRPPFVLIGDTFASDTFWHGPIMTGFAEDWVKLWTRGEGTFVMTQMEDSGYMEAVERLNEMHRLDRNRVLILRAGSNYCEPPPGHTPVESLTTPYVGMRLAFEDAYKVGSPVLHTLVNDWAHTRDHIPGS